MFTSAWDPPLGLLVFWGQLWVCSGWVSLSGFLVGVFGGVVLVDIFELRYGVIVVSEG